MVPVVGCHSSDARLPRRISPTRTSISGSGSPPPFLRRGVWRVDHVASDRRVAGCHAEIERTRPYKKHTPPSSTGEVREKTAPGFSLDPDRRLPQSLRLNSRWQQQHLIAISLRVLLRETWQVSIGTGIAGRSNIARVS